MLLHQSTQMEPTKADIQYFIRTTHHLHPPMTAIRLRFRHIPEYPVRRHLKKESITHAIKRREYLFAIRLRMFLPQPYHPLPVFPEQVNARHRDRHFIPDDHLLQIRSIRRMCPQRNSFQPPERSHLYTVERVHISPIQVVRDTFRHVEPHFFIRTVSITDMFQPIRKINLIGIDLHCVPIACFRQCIVAIACQRMDRVRRQQLCLLKLLLIQIDRIYRRPILKDPDFIRILCCLLPENLRRTIRTIMIDSYQLIQSIDTRINAHLQKILTILTAQ